MLHHNFLTYGGKLIIQLFGEILFFPIWWYSFGFFRFAKNSFKFWSNQEKALGFSVWAKNIFVPMYGQNDWAGRLISFLIRLVQVIFRGALVLLWLVFILLLIIGWLALPLLLFLALVFQVI